METKIDMVKKKETKWTSVYESPDEFAPIRTVYIRKTWLRNPEPTAIEVLIRQPD